MSILVSATYIGKYHVYTYVHYILYTTNTSTVYTDAYTLCIHTYAINILEMQTILILYTISYSYPYHYTPVVTTNLLLEPLNQLQFPSALDLKPFQLGYSAIKIIYYILFL